MKNILKKRHVFAISLLLAISVITAVTYSFYADRDEITNKMKLGIQSGEIVEEFDGTDKHVQFQNTGTTPLLIRANAKMICTNENVILDATKIAAVGYNLTDWMEGGDGWYYYKKILIPGETSTELVHITTNKESIPAEKEELYVGVDIKVPDDEKSLYSGAQLDVPVNLEYYLPLKDGDEYSHEVAWKLDNLPENIENASEAKKKQKAVRDMLRTLIEEAGEINVGETIEE